MRRLSTYLLALWLLTGCTVVMPSVSNSPQDHTLLSLPGEWEWLAQPRASEF